MDGHALHLKTVCVSKPKQYGCNKDHNGTLDLNCQRKGLTAKWQETEVPGKVLSRNDLVECHKEVSLAKQRQAQVIGGNA